jgi:hypothetical protein
MYVCRGPDHSAATLGPSIVKGVNLTSVAFTQKLTEINWVTGYERKQKATRIVWVFFQSDHDPVFILHYSGHETTPNSFSCLTVFLIAYLTGVVLLAAYSGALASFLAVQKSDDELPLKNFQDLLSDASYTMGVTPGSAVPLFQVRYLKFLDIYIVKNST